MKHTLFILSFIGMPYLVFSQAKTTAKSSHTSIAKNTNNSSSCMDNVEGLHITLSGKDYDEDGVTNVNGNVEFKDVPAGELVITKTGEEVISSTCKFVIKCEGGSRSCTKTGTFGELKKGVSFRMTKPGTVQFGVK